MSEDEIIRLETIDHLAEHRAESEARRDRKPHTRSLREHDSTLRHLASSRGLTSTARSDPRYWEPLSGGSEAMEREFIRRVQALADHDPSLHGEERFRMLAAYARQLGGEVTRG